MSHKFLKLSGLMIYVLICTGAHTTCESAQDVHLKRGIGGAGFDWIGAICWMDG